MVQHEADHSFGTVTNIKVEALGEPGHRKFRLLIESGAASACLWVEKEQVQQLAIYIQEVSETLGQTTGGSGQRLPEDTWAGEMKNVEFHVGRLALGHDSSTNSFLFLVHDVESAEDAAADLSFWVNLDMALSLSKEAFEACAAGRPRCFLCGLPINSEGHMCVRSNGHQPFQN